jgi:hypothetical protein
MSRDDKRLTTVATAIAIATSLATWVGAYAVTSYRVGAIEPRIDHAETKLESQGGDIREIKAGQDKFIIPMLRDIQDKLSK